MTEHEIIYSAATAEGAPDSVAKILISQSALESANWSSNLYKTSNNGYGMKMPKKRKSPYIYKASSITNTSEGTTPYASYKNLGDSTRDMIHWIRYNNIQWKDIDTPEKFASVLKKEGYYGVSEEHYYNAITKTFSQIKDSAIKAFNKHPELSLLTAITFFSLVGITIYRAAKFKK